MGCRVQLRCFRDGETVNSRTVTAKLPAGVAHHRRVFSDVVGATDRANASYGVVPFIGVDGLTYGHGTVVIYRIGVSVLPNTVRHEHLSAGCTTTPIEMA